MNLQSKFGYCIITQTLNIALYLKVGRNLGQTDKQTNGRTDDLISRCPRRTFWAVGHKNMSGNRCNGSLCESYRTAIFAFKF